MTISNAAMLTELNISVWTANKIDKDASRKVADDNNAAADSGHFRKNLMAGSTLRKDIADYAAGCRLWHNTRTMPWADRGPRLLPTSLFFDYKTEANARETYFNNKVSEFLLAYPRLVQTAQNYLGDLFNRDDYPHPDEVASKFGFRLVFSPVPDAGDFRLDLPKQELDAMRLQYEAHANERVEAAMQEQWGKLRDMVFRMSEKLTEPDDGDEDKRRWHDTFLTNAQEMCGMLTHLNITRDPTLEEARRGLERAIAGVDIDDIKGSEDTRTDVKGKLDDILKQYEW
jgi:hypothetical protein